MLLTIATAARAPHHKYLGRLGKLTPPGLHSNLRLSTATSCCETNMPNALLTILVLAALAGIVRGQPASNDGVGSVLGLSQEGIAYAQTQVLNELGPRPDATVLKEVYRAAYLDAAYDTVTAIDANGKSAGTTTSPASPAQRSAALKRYNADLATVDAEVAAYDLNYKIKLGARTACPTIARTRTHSSIELMIFSRSR